MAITKSAIGFEQSLAVFAEAEADTQLCFLQQLYQQVGDVLAAAPSAALFSQTVQRLVQQLLQVHRQDRLEVLRDIVQGTETRFSGEYNRLDINMKLAFWYRLLPNLPRELTTERLDFSRQESLATLLKDCRQMDSNQQVYWLRQIVDYLGRGSKVSVYDGAIFHT